MAKTLHGGCSKGWHKDFYNSLKNCKVEQTDKQTNTHSIIYELYIDDENKIRYSEI